MQLSGMRPDGSRNTPGRILKVDHAGEFGAVNIYRAQILVGSLCRAGHVAKLREFLAHEKQHRAIFKAELDRRGLRRSWIYPLCGVGGVAMGLLSGLLGRRAVMTCTDAVESVVLNHLEEQLSALAVVGDKQAYTAVARIIDDERHHQADGAEQSRDWMLYRPFATTIRWATEGVIWLGMRP